jgi:hypothetical protein
MHSAPAGKLPVAPARNVTDPAQSSIGATVDKPHLLR